MKIKLTATFAAMNILLALQLSAQSNEALGETAPSNAAPTVEKRSSVSGYMEMNYSRHYLWRGALWGNNDISQPAVHLEFRHFSLTLSPNLNLAPGKLSMDSYKQKTILDEHDFELGYLNSTGKLEYQVLLLGYSYFKQINTPNTGELCVNFKYPVGKNIKLFTENAADIGAYKGAFYNSTGAVYEKELNKLSIEYKLFTCYASSGFNSAYYGTDVNAVNLIGTSLYLEYSLLNKFYIAINGEYNRYVSKEIKAVTSKKKTDNFGISFGMEF